MVLATLLLAVLPLIVIFILIIVRNMPADIAALVGWVTTFFIACIFFDTPIKVALTVSLSGVIASLPIALAMGASSFQIITLAETGALKTIIATIKRLAPTDKCTQMLLINCGVGIFFTTIGALTIAILPPILLALGYTTLAAIALPCIGYTGACIYAIMGVPVVIFAQFAGLELHDAGILLAEFLPFLLTIVGLACLWLNGGKNDLIKGALPAIAAGVISGLVAIPVAKMGATTLTGIFVGLTYILVLICWLKIRQQPVLAKTEETHSLPIAKVTPLTSAPEKAPALPKAENTPPISLLAASSPWILLIILSFIVNAPFLPFFKLVFTDLAMPIEIIPGKPEKMRILWQSYLWITLSTLMCAPFIKAGIKELRAAFKTTCKRAIRPIASVACFFAIAALYVYSGYTHDWQPSLSDNNMVSVISKSAGDAFGTLYVVASPFLGLIGGIICGSQSGSIAMFTKMNLTIASNLGISSSLFALLSAFGGGLSGAIAPAKVMNAASVIDKVQEQGQVLRSILGVTLVLTLLIALYGYCIL